ncbi:guanyl-nucleotide exchange factor [Aureococcus anophagefferens]|uniref:Guanyl-nucleotide exchange factor n=1 Tax=Aureococcus anophagefferens TaxID=44056 RepID=A0ABR1GCW9_AURAN
MPEQPPDGDAPPPSAGAPLEPTAEAPPPKRRRVAPAAKKTPAPPRKTAAPRKRLVEKKKAAPPKKTKAAPPKQKAAPPKKKKAATPKAAPPKNKAAPPKAAPPKKKKAASPRKDASSKQKKAKQKKAKPPPSEETERQRAAMENVQAARRWPDGTPLGKGHTSPYIQPKYADDIMSGAKTWEGRACTKWLEKLSVDDWIMFKISGSSDLIYARAREVVKFDTFEEMLDYCGLDACLPGCPSVADGVKIYRSFGCFDGRTYADVEAESGVVAIRFEVL